jgi:ATP-dependent Lon protease
MVSALISLFSDRAVKSGFGITGEITLRGRVLPVGGIKMKVLAAHRAGLKAVILPKRNERDLEDIPDEVRNAVQFSPVERIDDAIEILFEGSLNHNNTVPCESVDPFINHMSPVHANCQGDGE